MTIAGGKCALLTFLVFVAITPYASGKSEPLPPMTPDKWRADVDYFARELPKRHKNAFHAMTREQFESEVAALRARAETADDAQMIVGLMRITALVGDGHTYVRLPSSTTHFPLSVVQIEGDYRIVRAAGAASELVKGKLVRIDDTPLADAVTRIHTIVAQDESDVLLTAFTPQWFSVPDVLHGLGITKSATAAQFTVAFDDGTERSATVAAATTAETQPRLAAANLPLYRQRQTEMFWFTWLEDAGTVYVNFRKYDDLKAKSHELWSFVDAHPVKKVVIDLRQNGGGDFNVGRKYLVDELARRPKLRGYVITSGKTFSAALKNAIDFRDVAHATLVGETIGEKPNSYSENDEMTLPNSRIEVSYSTRYYQFLPKDGLVTPDQTIVPTWADWLAGRDPVLDWILKQ